VSTPLAYWLSVAIGAAVGATLCVGARRRPGRWTGWAARVLAVLLATVAVTFAVTPITDGTWSARDSLPLNLCDLALVVAVVACWQPRFLLAVELTYFWGLAGTAQAVATPDLSIGFPHLGFFEFVVGHLGIVVAAVYLVVGLRRTPRRGAVWRVFAITVGYTSLVGVVDWWSGANYMFLAAIPDHESLLSALGPWPWYLLSATGVALVLLTVLDAPFRIAARRRPTRLEAAIG
jgi:hypothetical integral membrane protein (TIGR02206 family)